MKEKLEALKLAFQTNQDNIIQKTAIVGGIILGALAVGVAVAIASNDETEEFDLDRGSDAPEVSEETL